MNLSTPASAGPDTPSSAPGGDPRPVAGAARCYPSPSPSGRPPRGARGHPARLPARAVRPLSNKPKASLRATPASPPRGKGTRSGTALLTPAPPLRADRSGGVASPGTDAVKTPFRAFEPPDPVSFALDVWGRPGPPPPLPSGRGDGVRVSPRGSSPAGPRLRNCERGRRGGRGGGAGPLA